MCCNDGLAVGKCTYLGSGLNRPYIFGTTLTVFLTAGAIIVARPTISAPVLGFHIAEAILAG
jgi:hypothetical protein